MKRREFSLAGSSAWLSLGPLAAVVSPAWAQIKKPENGTEYLTLDRQVAVDAPVGKVEVIEFFWYSCPHCNAFEPRLQEWLKNLPKDVAFKRVPVAFREDFGPQQRLYYALEAMGKVEALHRKVFYAVHVERQLLNSRDSLADWVAKQGLDRSKFLELYDSFSVVGKIRRALQLQDAYQVAGVPALGIAGRYYTDGTQAKTMERALQVTDYLIEQSRKKA
jgi:protein dithiol oxidoreductase (disulfide-forming)